VSVIDGPACRLWVEIVGDGAPVTVVAHGLASSTRDLFPLAQRLPGTTVLLDLRGHGRSDSPPDHAGYDHPAMRADVEHVADRYGATHALGVSLGAGAIMNLLGDRPERFERIVFVLPSRIDESCDDVDGTLAMADLIEHKPLGEMAEEMLAMPALADLLERHPGWRAQIRGQLLAMNPLGVPRAYRAYALGRPPLDDAELLRRVRVPGLVVANADDPAHPVEVAIRLAALMPDARLEIYDDFAMFIDDLDGFAARVAAFLTGG
jgi:pimeloyl-ACP methyl ester carboxylesterase